MTRMSEGLEREREALENALALMARALTLMQGQVRLRLQQAYRRWPGDLLGGALEYADEVEWALQRAQKALGEYWARRTQDRYCSSKKNRKVRKFTRTTGGGATRRKKRRGTGRKERGAQGG